VSETITYNALDNALLHWKLLLTEHQKQQLLGYINLLHRWNQVYNISGHRQIEQMFQLHVLDSLSIVQPLKQYLLNRYPNNQDTKLKILDVGSGAGLPGIVLAICFPEYEFVCIDAVAKKIAFLQQVKIQLQLQNTQVIHTRVENHGAKYQIITSRAFSSLHFFTQITNHCISDKGCWFAMKGKYPVREIEQLDSKLEVFHVEQLDIPELDAERCLVWIRNTIKG
jgi:16S rRNA (guanine527-N7)-methyltransferase